MIYYRTFSVFTLHQSVRWLKTIELFLTKTTVVEIALVFKL